MFAADFSSFSFEIGSFILIHPHTEDKKGVVYHLEIEGADVVDHARRTIFYGYVTDGGFPRKGRDYSELAKRYIFYIGRKDIWKDGCTVYEEEKEDGL